jgi:hypothetical protein
MPIVLGMGQKSGIKEFLQAFVPQWATAMSGGLSVPLAIAAFFVTNDLARISLGFTAIVCFIASAYLVWRKERRRTIETEERLLAVIAYGEKGYPNLRVADCPQIVDLFIHTDTKLFALLSSGDLTSWARSNIGKSRKLVKLNGAVWDMHEFKFIAKGLRVRKDNQTFLKGDARDTMNGIPIATAYYDVCLNVAQIKQFWPKLSSLEPNEMQS